MGTVDAVAVIEEGCADGTTSESRGSDNVKMCDCQGRVKPEHESTRRTLECSLVQRRAGMSEIIEVVAIERFVMPCSSIRSHTRMTVSRETDRQLAR